MNFHFDELGYDPDEAREGREIDRRKKMATTRKRVSRNTHATWVAEGKVTLVKIGETKGTFIYGPEDGDPTGDAPFTKVYMRKENGQGPDSITITAN